MIPILDLKAQYQSIKDEINAAIAGVLESAQFITLHLYRYGQHHLPLRRRAGLCGH